MVDPDKLFGRLGNRMFQMAYIYAQVQEGNIPDIYVQDPKYFEKYEDEIQQWFGYKRQVLDYVGVHVRRGDYTNNPFYVDLSRTDYYGKAMGVFPGQKFLVFSDDVDFCRKMEAFNRPDVFFAHKTDELTDLNDFSSCKHQIIANSSYSWWGAYLNRNPEKTVVAPSVKNWYADGLERTKCPQDWIRL